MTPSVDDLDFDPTDWDSVPEAAKGTTVSYYGWGEEQELNTWFDVTYADYLKETYDITLERVNMGAANQVSQLTTEKESGVGVGEGSMDIIWTCGEFFNNAKENGLLWGSYADYLPAMDEYIDTDDYRVSHDDFGDYEIDGMETPAVNTPFIMFRDADKTDFAPKNTDEFLEFCKEYPGQVTYVAPNTTDEGIDWLGCIIGEICGYDWWENVDNDYDSVKEAIEPALEYLRELNPYLWKNGSSFPETMDEVYTMYSDGELVMGMTGYPLAVGQYVEDGTYPESTESFIFDSGCCSYIDYYSIPYNCPNFAGALVVINDLLTADTQISRMSAGYLPFLGESKLSDSEKEAMDDAATEAAAGTDAVIDIDEVLEASQPIISSTLNDVFYQVWQNEVVGKTNE